MSRIRKNFLYNSSLNLLNIIYPIITLPYVSRILGVEQIGIYTFITTIVTYFRLFSSLGTPLYGTREIAKFKHDFNSRNSVFNEIFSINIITSICSSILYIAIIYSIPKFYEYFDYFLIAGSILYFSSFNIDWFYSGIEDYKLITQRSIIIKLLTVICLFLFVKTQKDLANYILLSSIAIFGNQIWNVTAIHKYQIKIKFTLKNFRRHITSLYILFLSTIAQQIYLMIDTVMLGFLSTYIEVGLYNTAIKSIRIIMPLTMSLCVVLLPRISQLTTEKKKDEIYTLLNKTFQTLLFFSIPLVLYFITVSSYFIRLFFGEEYINASTTMKICSLLFLIGNLSYFFGVQILVMSSKEKDFLKCTIIGTIGNILGNAILIPLIGANGAAIASIIGESLVTSSTIYFTYKHKLFKPNWIEIKKYLLASISFIICAALIPSECNYIFKLSLITILGWLGYFIISIYTNKESYPIQECLKLIRR